MRVLAVSRRVVLAWPLARPAAACSRQLVAELPVRLVEDYALVTARIAGQAASLLLDTGAQGMLVTPEAAEALHLPLRGMTRVLGTGGSQPARLVVLPGLRLGDAAMPEQLAPVAALPIALDVQPPLAGLLGASLLSRFDLELDVAQGRVALWAPSACEAPMRGTMLPLEVSRAGEAFLPVRVNGEPLLALLDTGSRATLLTQGTARRLGLGGVVSANTARGVDGERMPLEHVRARLGLGSEAAVDTPMSVAPLQLDRGDMLLGLDVLRRRRVFVAYGRGEVTFGPPP